MISLTQLKEVMTTGGLSVEGRAKLDALIEKNPLDGFAILLEGHPLVKTFGSGSIQFAVLSTPDVVALQDLREYDSSIVLYSGDDGASVVPMYLVYNDLVVERDQKQYYFDFEYQINHQDEWRPAMSSGASEAQAISNFSMNYCLSIGTVTAVRAVK
jgi:hypothetical protein